MTPLPCRTRGTSLALLLVSALLLPAAAGASTSTAPPPSATETRLPVDSTPTTSEIARALARNGATRIRVQPWTETDPATDTRVAARGLPSDIFTVWTTWASYWKNGKLRIAFYGRWAYKGGFIGSGDPDDISAMRLTGFPMRCWTKMSAGVTTNNEFGERTSLSYRKSDGHASSIWGVQDDTRAFQLENRYGFHWIDMRRDRVLSACRARKAGSYFMEHNQEGSGGWSAGVTLLALSVSYTGSGGQRLQKAATYDYY